VGDEDLPTDGSFTLLKRLFFKDFWYVTFKTEVDWNGRVPGSCGKCGKAETPQER